MRSFKVLEEDGDQGLVGVEGWVESTCHIRVRGEGSIREVREQ